MLKANKINLMARLREAPSGGRAGRRRLRLGLPVACLLLAALAVPLVLDGLAIPGLERRYEALWAQLQREDYAQAEGDLTRQQALLAGLEADRLLQESLDSYADYTAWLHTLLYTTADGQGIDIEGLRYERATGQLELDCRGPAVTSAADFAQALGAIHGLDTITYSGYSGTGQGYRFTIRCTWFQITQ